VLGGHTWFERENGLLVQKFGATGAACKHLSG